MQMKQLTFGFLVLMFVVAAALEQRLLAQAYDLPNNNSGCPANCRQIPWSAGSDLWNGGTLPNYASVTCSAAVANGTDQTTNINNCINAASAGTAVFLPGNSTCYYINGTVRLKNQVVLRGAGMVFPLSASTPQTTCINLGANGSFTTQNFSHSSNLNPATSYNTLPSTFTLSGTPQKGDTTVTIGSGTVTVGTWIKIFGNDDPSLISDLLCCSGGSNYHGDFFGDDTGFYLMQQAVQVTAIVSGTGGAGSVVSISRPLYYPPDTTARTVAGPGGVGNVTEPAGAKYNIITFPTQKAGYESFTVTATGDVGAGQIINLQGCLYCWVKGVETVTSGSNSNSAHIEMDWTYGVEIRDSYVHDQRSGASGAGYGIYFQFPSSDGKVENNVVRHSRHGIIFQSGGSGHAILYNYVDDGYTDDLTYLASVRSNHGAHPYMILWEGNVINHFAADDCWGTSSHQVLFRNWLWGDFTGNWTLASGADAPAPSGSNPSIGFDGIDLYTGQTYYSMVGNVLGISGKHTTWSGATLRTLNPYGTRANPVVYSYGGAAGTAGDGTTCDTILNSTAPSSNTTSLNHGNYDYKTNGVAYWEGGSNHTLRNSMYYSSKPAFFGSCTWPAFGPDLTPVTNKLPAKAWYESDTSCSASAPAPPTDLTTVVQ